MANNKKTNKILMVTIQEYSHKDRCHDDQGTEPMQQQRPIREYQLIARNENDGRRISTRKPYGNILCRPKEESSSTPTHVFFSSFRRVLLDLFMPAGYPHSLGKEADSYWKYQVWDGIQGLCSYWP
jgi:hypothetical protein